MPIRWKTTYTLAQAVEIDNPIGSYPDIGISLFYDTDGKLIRVEHQLDTEDTATVDDVFALSQQHLELFWEVLHYQRGFPLTISSRSAEQIQAIPGAPSIRTSEVRLTFTAAICRVIEMPDQGLFTSPNSRLIVWLRLANEARSAVIDGDAIRNYYMIWEDMQGRPTPTTAPPAANELKFVRDFVSHGEALRNRDLLAFIQAELGKPVNRYDPTDVDQQSLVRKHREQARQLVKSELSKQL
jgi:hypothetical protein